MFRLEYAGNSAWWPYTTFGGYYEDGIRGDTGLQHDGEPVMAPSSFRTIQPTSSIPKPDPRTARYGASMSYAIGNPYYGPTQRNDVFEVGMVATSAPGEIVGNNNGPGNGSDASDYTGATHPGMLFRELGRQWELIPRAVDGVTRPGDGALGSKVTGSNCDGMATPQPTPCTPATPPPGR